MNMETKDNWIENILNSTEGITKVAPSDDLFLRIQNHIKEEKVAPQTIWLVAASIMVLVLLNVTAIKSKMTSKPETAQTYMSVVVSENNQIYQ